ncbi:MAG: hypothetical protein FD127_2414 [Acidimicrobiaceae bacterium]|nr:MAG: hypothetical protein FD127_2414 [Acidimicrobiaceae bacterium]
MATPLSDLFDRVINDPETRTEFAADPEAFLHEHGYTALDAADVQEVMYILADGSPPATAVGYVAAGNSIGDLDPDMQHGLTGAASALGTAVAVIAPGTVEPVVDPVDPGELDGLDDTDDDTDDADDVDDADAAGIGDDVDPGDLDPDDLDAVAHNTDGLGSLDSLDSGSPDLDGSGRPDADITADADADAFDVLDAILLDPPDLSATVDHASTDTTATDDSAGDGWDEII